MKLLLAVLLLALSGCAYFQPVTNRLGTAVKDYCTQPLETRRIVRMEVNKASAPNSVLVTCAGDPA